MTAVIVVLLLIPWKGHAPLPSVAPPVSSDAAATPMVVVTPGASLLGTPSASARLRSPTTTVRKQRTIAAEPKPIASDASSKTPLREAVQNADQDVNLERDVSTEILNAIDALGSGKWPEDYEATRWAMIATIRSFLPQFAKTPWPDGRTSIAQLKPVFYKALEVKKFMDLVTLLKASPAPAPSTTP